MASGDSSDRVDPAAALPDVILPFRKPGTGLDKESDETLSLQEREILSRIHVRALRHACCFRALHLLRLGCATSADRLAVFLV